MSSSLDLDASPTPLIAGNSPVYWPSGPSNTPGRKCSTRNLACTTLALLCALMAMASMHPHPIATSIALRVLPQAQGSRLGWYSSPTPMLRMPMQLAVSQVPSDSDPEAKANIREAARQRLQGLAKSRSAEIRAPPAPTPPEPTSPPASDAQAGQSQRERLLAAARAYKASQNTGSATAQQDESGGAEVRFSAKVGNGKSVDIPSLTSLNGRTRLTLGDDGNLVLSSKFGHPSSPVQRLWSTNTSGQGTGPYRLNLGRDGCLQILDRSDKAIWRSPSDSGIDTAASIRVYDDGSLTIYDGDMKQLWSAPISMGSNKAPEKVEEYTPSGSGSWGVFARPKDISKAYGGGKVIKPGYMGTPEEIEARRKDYLQAISAAKSKREGEVDPELLEEAEANFTRAEKATYTRKYAEAEEILRDIRRQIPFRNELHGKAMLELATVLDAQGQFSKARDMYKSLATHPNRVIRRDAKRFLEAFESLEFMKLDGVRDTSGQKVISPLIIKFANEYDGKTAAYYGTADDEEIARQTVKLGIILLAIFFLFPVVTVWYLANFHGSY
uniref:Bulb-type lectin domain-containing protein n=1 Tax=Eutreptiella gymnastica TaxID=73025 RepID=A0A7S4CXY5_9EUGL